MLPSRMRKGISRLCTLPFVKLFVNQRTGVSCDHMIHIVSMAIVMAAVLTVVKSFGWLDGLDALSLRIASTWISDQKETGPTRVFEPTGKPVIVTLTDELYETRFGQRSPLDREELARIIAELTGMKWRCEEASDGETPSCRWCPASDANRPRLLVIDLDLSPGPSADKADASKSDLTAEERLDALILALGKEMRVVLMNPIWVVTPELIEKKAEWMQRLCMLSPESPSPARGIVFGFSELVSEQSILLKHDRFSPTIAGLAAVALLEDQSGPFSLNDKQQGLLKKWQAGIEDGDINPLCDLVTLGERYFLMSPDWRSKSDVRLTTPSKKLYPIYWPIINETESLRLGKCNAFGISQQLPDIQERTDVIFLGGDYGSSDKFNTPYGIVDGVYAHAASFGTYLHPTSKTSKLVVFLIDIVFGIIFGLALHASWHKVLDSEGAFQRVRNQSIHFTLFFGGIVGLLFVSGVLMIEVRIWLQPAPLLLGAYLDFLHHHFYKDVPTSGHDGQLATRQDRIVADLSVGVKLLFIVAAVVFIILDLIDH